MKIFKIFIFTIFYFSLLNSNELPNSLKGNIMEEYYIRTDINLKKNEINYHYKDGKCTSKLTKISKYTFKEKIIKGGCISGGVITIKPKTVYIFNWKKDNYFIDGEFESD